MSLLALKIVRTTLLFYIALGVFGWFFADSLIFFPPRPGYSSASNIHMISNGNGQAIAATYLQNASAKYTVLYNHGNATDIGYLNHLINDFHKHGYSILAYDYSGYGLSSGSPSEEQAYVDAVTAYDYLVDELATEPGHIIVYGHSLGAAIATDLASRKPVAGLVLESAFASAFRVRTILPIYPFDKFSNTSKISSVASPVLIMHGRDDPVIPFWHSELLYEMAVAPKTHYWLDLAGHNGIPYSGDMYWQHLQSFVQAIDKT